jgi:hypothetical protein
LAEVARKVKEIIDDKCKVLEEKISKNPKKNILN